MIDAWLVAHALPPGITTSLHNDLNCDEDEDSGDDRRGKEEPPSNKTENEAQTQVTSSSLARRTLSCGSKSSKASSGSATPVRKISAQEFERVGLQTKPLVTTVDGTPTFLSPRDNSG